MRFLLLQFVHVFYVFPSAIIVCSETLLLQWIHDFAQSLKTRKKRVTVIKYRLTDYKMLKL